jgi:hypothetical protein
MTRRGCGSTRFPCKSAGRAALLVKNQVKVKGGVQVQVQVNVKVRVKVNVNVHVDVS